MYSSIACRDATLPVPAFTRSTALELAQANRPSLDCGTPVALSQSSIFLSARLTGLSSILRRIRHAVRFDNACDSRHNKRIDECQGICYKAYKLIVADFEARRFNDPPQIN